MPPPSASDADIDPRSGYCASTKTFHSLRTPEIIVTIIRIVISNWQTGYGLTETTAGFCRAVGEEESARIGSVGRLSWGAEVKIVHPETGAAMPPDVPGELWVRGPFVMKGYHGEEDSTSEILDSEGWLRTGDVCYIDQDGFIYTVDRLKELIKYKGYQVPPAELESLLQTHPDIVEAAVVPYPDDEAGELPVAL
ncbi:4-coumarate--CoA ligase-like 9 [Miscanthus floridulus]|uniref:4-coumarate--CoA ligase-like 9 n=1 Tax=Miscanthus floridulus TaxID=154761 RepID=UPI00345AB18F